jgi:hypothetical protein
VVHVIFPKKATHPKNHKKIEKNRKIFIWPRRPCMWCFLLSQKGKRQKKSVKLIENSEKNILWSTWPMCTLLTLPKKEKGSKIHKKHIVIYATFLKIVLAGQFILLMLWSEIDLADASISSLLILLRQVSLWNKAIYVSKKGNSKNRVFFHNHKTVGLVEIY